MTRPGWWVRVVLAAATITLSSCGRSHGADGPPEGRSPDGSITTGTVDAGLPPVSPPATQICECCGVEVEWPADTSCGLGACDGVCNACLCEEPPPGCRWADSPTCCTELICDEGGEPSCAPMDARPDPCDGSCGGDDFVGVAWDGQACRVLSCGCVGEDCDALYATEAECEQAHGGCDSALCESSGGVWLSEPIYCGHRHCGVPPLADCDGGPVCDCGPGSAFARGVGCEDVSCDLPLLCSATGGTPAPCDDDADCPFECVCPAHFDFDVRAGCVPGDRSSEEDRCVGTGGDWDTYCCASECGQPCPEPCFDFACRCGPDEVFHPERGCVTSSTCNGGAFGETCSSRPCADGLVCCAPCGSGEAPRCQPPMCGSGTTDGCPVCA